MYYCPSYFLCFLFLTVEAICENAMDTARRPNLSAASVLVRTTSHFACSKRTRSDAPMALD
jgi:hypothetical protein